MIGAEQIIPTTGPHEQIMIDAEQAQLLVWIGYIVYDPEYGPNAKVYRPVSDLVDADKVRSWLP
jgi:hypothetical protein